MGVEESCCTKNLKPACCAVKPTADAIQEQVALWGTLLSLILVLGLFIWFCRSDQSLLDGETPCLQKFCPCCGFKRRGDDGHLHDKSDGFGSSVSLQSSKSTVIMVDEEENKEVEDTGETEDPQPEEGTEEEGQNDDEAAPENAEGSEPPEVPAEDG